MAKQIKNTFLKSKMNKDLDNRLLPNGEYKDALNISVGRSESDDIGALENVIGNNLLLSTDLFPSDVETIGVYASDTNASIYIFLTNYTDPNPNEPTPSPENKVHYIYSYNSNSNQYTKLVEGSFLNFSKTNRIIGINLLEELLFWTDNRNQPRKINLNLAVVSDAVASSSSSSKSTPAPAAPATNFIYYTKEHQISVAKYNPYQAIQLYNRIKVEITSSTTTSFTLAGNQTATLLPYVGATVLTDDINGTDFITVTAVTTNGGQTITTCTISPAAALAIPVGSVELIKSTMSNKDSDSLWAGDPNYLEDKYARFSYRFKYDDNEYSLMAPFTQIAYIPTQKGYFVEGDEDAAYQSTVVQFMKNNVQNIGLVIPLPDEARNISTNYKIEELEILFREAGSQAVKVLESIPVSIVSEAGATNTYTYDYQSRKPYRTLPEAQTVRVYDKVPIRAFSQESAGNRVIYGNYIDKHTPPNSLNYNCRVSEKLTSGTFNNFVEYPNSSVKRNRNYQVGFILADKYGRSSPVILSSVDKGITVASQFYSGSTFYNPYDDSAVQTNIKNWFGDAIFLTINSTISSFKNSTIGTPGLYATPVDTTTSGIGYAVVEEGFISGNNYVFTLDPALPNNRNIPSVGNSLRGEYIDYVTVTAISQAPATLRYTVTCDGQVNQSYLWVVPPTTVPATPVLRFAYDINELGWYSYKVVVKQTQQDYYNAYLPGFLNGYPSSIDDANNPRYPVVDPKIEFPTNEINKTAHVVLLNDNINKIPRDLSEVGPEQRQYRSSVKLYGRVNNELTALGAITSQTVQYFPRSGNSKNATNNVVSTIATARDLEFFPSDIFNSEGLYQLNTNPYIARISTAEDNENNPLGVVMSIPDPNSSATKDTAVLTPMLTIYETEAQESLLDIYWESTSEGLVADLNFDILNSVGGGTQIEQAGVTLVESTSQNEAITSFIRVLNAEGGVITTAFFSDFEVFNGYGNNVTNNFSLEAPGQNDANAGAARIILETPLVFGSASANPETPPGPRDIFQFKFNVTAVVGGVPQASVEQVITGSLENAAPSFINFPDTIINMFENDVVVVEGGEISAVNGANSNTQLGLQYSITVDPPVEGWVITEEGSSPAISCPAYSANPGKYTIAVTVTDASGGEGSLSVTNDIEVLIKPAELNSGLIESGYICTFNPTANSNEVSNQEWLNDNKVIGSIRGFFEIGLPVRRPVNGIWYISEEDLSPNNKIKYGRNDQIPSVFNRTLTDSGGWDTFIFKLSSVAHTKGTLAMSVNLSMNPTFNLVDGDWSFDHKMGVTSAKWYYRYAKTLTQAATPFEPLTRDGDENQSFPSRTDGVGFPEGGSLRADARREWPSGFVNLFNEDVGGGYRFDDYWEWATREETMYSSGIRTSNYKNYQTLPTSPGVEFIGRPIEYAIVVTQLSSTFLTSNSGLDRGDNAVAWTTIDDLNKANCVPGFGTNLAATSSVLTVNRSEEYNGDPAYKATNGNLQLFTNIYYGEMITNLFEDNELTTVYKPSSNDANYINYSLPAGIFGTSTDMKGEDFGTSNGLQWRARFDINTGAKTESEDNVGSVQTSTDLDPEGNNEYIKYDKATIRNFLKPKD